MSFLPVVRAICEMWLDGKSGGRQKLPSFYKMLQWDNRLRRRSAEKDALQGRSACEHLTSLAPTPWMWQRTCDTKTEDEHCAVRQMEATREQTQSRAESLAKGIYLRRIDIDPSTIAP